MGCDIWDDTAHRRLNRFIFLTAVCVFGCLGCVLSEAAAGEQATGLTDPSNSPSSQVTIEVGYWAGEKTTDWMLEEIDRFRKANPSISVMCVGMERPTRGEKELEELERLPRNVIGIDSEQVYEVAYLVDRGLLRPIESFLPDPAFNPDDFYEKVWDAVTYKGERWGVPYSCSPRLFLLDWDLFKGAGVESPPKTWDEVISMGRTLTKDRDGDGRIDQWGLRIGLSSFAPVHWCYLWETMVLQKGGVLMVDGRFKLGDGIHREAYEFLRHLAFDSGVANIDNRNILAVLPDTSVRYAMQFVPIYHFDKTRIGKQYRLAPWPTFGSPVTAEERRNYLAILKSTPEKEAASWELVKWFSRQNINLPHTATELQVTARKDIIAQQDFRQLAARYCLGFDELQNTKGSMAVVYTRPVAGAVAANERLQSIVADLFDGKLNFEESMSKAEMECNAILDAAENVPRPYSLYYE